MPAYFCNAIKCMGNVRDAFPQIQIFSDVSVLRCHKARALRVLTWGGGGGGESLRGPGAGPVWRPPGAGSAGSGSRTSLGYSVSFRGLKHGDGRALSAYRGQ